MFPEKNINKVTVFRQWDTFRRFAAGDALNLVSRDWKSWCTQCRGGIIELTSIRRFSSGILTQLGNCLAEEVH
jgi:hypothetical protein